MKLLTLAAAVVPRSIGVRHLYTSGLHSVQVSSSFARAKRHTSEKPALRLLRRSNNFRSLPMMPELIDVDCNLWHRDMKSLQSKDSTEDEENPWNILQEDAVEASNIVAMLSPSSTIGEAKKGLKLLKSGPPPPLLIKTTVGVHPYHVNDEEFKGKSAEDHSETIMELLRDHAELCGAVGECGLDASEGFPPLEDQIPWFRMQVEVAKQLVLPLFVHERLAFEDTMKILGEDLNIPVIIHCFTGTKDQCMQYIERGYYISLSGYILKETNDNHQEVISCLEEGVIPLDRLMIETDAPYMGFSNCRQLYLDHNADFVAGLNSKKRKRLQQSTYPNVPSSLPKVLDRVVECLQSQRPELSREDVASQITNNSRSFFGF